MSTISSYPITQLATELLTKAEVVVDQQKLDTIITKSIKKMLKLKLNPHSISPAWEGPAGVHHSFEPKQNLENIADWGSVDVPELFALSVLMHIQQATGEYAEIDGKNQFVEGDNLSPQMVRAYVQANKTSYNITDEDLVAQATLKLMGLEDLSPTESELAITQIYIESIADSIYLPGILQSQEGWSERGAVDAYKQRTRHVDYDAGFSGAGLDEYWPAITRNSWPILLQAALLRHLVDTDEKAYELAMRNKLRGYLLGIATTEYLLHNPEHYPKNLTDSPKKNPSDLSTRTSQYYQEQIEGFSKVREAVVAASSALTTA